jgi:hypothetical protein
MRSHDLVQAPDDADLAHRVTVALAAVYSEADDSRRSRTSPTTSLRTTTMLWAARSPSEHWRSAPLAAAMAARGAGAMGATVMRRRE